MVPASSSVRDKFFGARFLLANSVLYILPGRTIDIYWSAVIMFTPIHVAIVVTINEPVDFVKVSKDLTITFNKPVVSKTAP